IADVDAELAGVDGVEGVFGVDIGRHTTLLLHLRDYLQAERRLAGRLRTVDFDHTAPRQAAGPECDVEAKRARGYDLQVILNLGLAHPHDRALAELLLDLRERGSQRFALVVVHGESCGRERHFEGLSVVRMAAESAFLMGFRPRLWHRTIVRSSGRMA